MTQAEPPVEIEVDRSRRRKARPFDLDDGDGMPDLKHRRSSTNLPSVCSTRTPGSDEDGHAPNPEAAATRSPAAIGQHLMRAPPAEEAAAPLTHTTSAPHGDEHPDEGGHIVTFIPRTC
ncbi:hypothetical protein [Nonomuraea dietziae]|uniref:hypothetical protein n=1 Tax=Nonomuraea dietziae TaxID=65515 RepID=UPI0031D49E86